MSGADGNAAAPQPPAKRPRIDNGDGRPDEWVASANDALRFHLLDDFPPRSAGTELDHGRGEVFSPEYTHQVFGEEEEIHGYMGLRVDVWLSARTFFAMASVAFERRRPQSEDVMGKMGAAWGAGLTSGREEFERAVGGEPVADFMAEGRVVGRRPQPEGETVVVCARLSTASDALKALHARMEPLLLYFVDGASSIDNGDPKWDIYLALQQQGDTTRVVGFSTVYNFYVFPDSVRKRLAQILVLPPYQNNGVGTLLVEAVYSGAKEENAMDVTLEDPTDEVKHIRDKLALKSMLECTWLRPLVSQYTLAATSGDEPNGASLEENTQNDMATAPSASNSTATCRSKRNRLAIPGQAGRRLQRELKIPSCQIACLWESILYLAAVADGKDVAPIESLVKHRLQTMMNMKAETEKLIFGDKTPDGGEADGFILLKCRNVPQQFIAGSMTASEFASTEQKEVLLANAVKERMQEIDDLVSNILESA
eukprot:evm.model.scf_195.5 EVM.evm.TU.scf_195.5   scf_195:32086-36316(-)